MEAMYTGILLFIIFCLIFLCYRSFYARKEKSLIPTNLPIFGMMPALLVNLGRVDQLATEVLEQSGGTFLFRGPWLTNMEMLFTCDPTNIHYILTKNFLNFPKGPEFKKIFDVLGDGIFVAESESWENQRKTDKSLINHTSFQEFVATTSWKKVETSLIPILEMDSEMGMEVDMQDLFQRFSFDCSCIQVLGHDPASLSTELPHLPPLEAFADAEEAILYRHILPEIYWKLQNWLRIGKEKKLSQAKQIIDRFISYCRRPSHIATYFGHTSHETWFEG